MKGRKVIKIILICVIVLIIGGYSLFQARKVIEGPQISIDNPKEGQTVSGPELTISGKAKNISFLFLNGKKIFTNDSGVFNEVTIVSLGTNVLELRAKDKFGNEIVKHISVFRNN